MTMMNYDPSDTTLVDTSSIGLNLDEEGSHMSYYNGHVEFLLIHWIVILSIWISL